MKQQRQSRPQSAFHRLDPRMMPRRANSSIKTPTGLQTLQNGRNQYNQSQNSLSNRRGGGMSGNTSQMLSNGGAHAQSGLSIRQQSMGQRKQSHTVESMQPIQNEKPMMRNNANRFRIAQPAQQLVDVSGKYWNQIGNQINVEKNLIQMKLQSQRLAPATLSNASGLQTLEVTQKLNFQQSQLKHPLTRILEPLNPQLTNVPSDNDIFKHSHTPIVGNTLIYRNDLDQLQKPFSFLANVGGKETSSHLLTANIDKSLLHNNVDKKSQKRSINPSQKEGTSLAIGDTSTMEGDFVTFNNSKNVQDLVAKQKSIKAKVDIDSTKQVQITIFTDMNVDNHDFDIRERRKAQRVASAFHRPQSTFRSQKNSIPALTALGNYKHSKVTTPQIQQNFVVQPHGRPVSGMVPQTHSQKILPQMAQQQIQFGMPQQTALNQVDKQSNKAMKISSQSRRPFSANPKYLQIAGLDRPFSAQLKMGNVHNARESIQSIYDTEEEDVNEELEDEYVDLNIYNEDDKNYNQQLDTETFSQHIMNSRPTTAYKKEKLNYDMPFPELFDRSQRTFAATFAKYGDLAYYTPIQRIGSYMDFNARLKKRHLLDLIAYIKTTKKPIKPSDEEINEAEQAHKDYLESCLFIGVMPEEDNPRVQKTVDIDRMDEMQEIELAQDRVYEGALSRCDGTFQYEKVWSETLMNQVKLSVHRFFKYIESQDAIRNEEISKYKKEWMSHALDLVPDQLLSTYSTQVKALFSEIFANYAKAMRQSILEYILRSPEERKRLHIVMLPRPIPIACERALMKGGYSTVKYSGMHQRKLETENEIKLRLVNNNIVISALQSWFQDFRSFNLVEFRNLSQFLNNKNEQPGQAQYCMDIDSFLRFQEAYRQKVLQVLKQIWYRGCMTIIKKFKFLRLREDQQRLQHGQNCAGKWTFTGFNPRPYETDNGFQRQSIPDLKWQDFDTFNFTSLLNKQSPLQSYYSRTGTTHNHLPLFYFEQEEGFEIGTIPHDCKEHLDLNDLVDIRENSAYIAFVSMIGGYINFEENGYDILTKEYKRELKYAGGNLMRLQMRQIVDKAVSTIVNYFKGFMTFEKLKKVVNHRPMREFKILVQKEWKSTKQRLEEARKKREEEERLLKQPMSKYEEVQMKKKLSSRIKLNAESTANLQPWDKEPILKLPDYFDYQDFVNPVLRLDLTLVNTSTTVLSQSTSQMQNTQFGSFTSIQGGDTLEFTKRQQDILEDFDLFLHRTISSFNEFLVRPEFAKVKVVSQKRYEADLEEEARMKKLSIQVKAQQPPPILPSSSTLNLPNNPTNGRQRALSGQSSFHAGSGVSQNQTVMSGTSHNNGNGLGGNNNACRIKDFDQILYNGHEDGADVYRKYLGRIQIVESEKETKDLIDENNMGVYAKPYVDKYYTVADADYEVGYANIRQSISKILIRHLKEAKRVVELFDQFEPLIKGTLQIKVREFLSEERKEKEYEIVIKELRYYEKLSAQLPTIVFFPMFEVGTIMVKNELQRRIKNLLTLVFKKFENALVVKSQAICDKYSQICKYLDKVLKTPHDVVDMERYKNNLLLEIGSLQERMYENRKNVFFLLHQDKVYEEETWSLIKELHEWPAKLNNHMDLCDERHRNERHEIENAVTLKKEKFEDNTAKLEENIQEVQQWGDLYGYRLVISKVIDYQTQIDQYEEQMIEISQEEMMLFGFKTTFEVFLRVKKFFEPYYELWTSISELMVNKRRWLESPLSHIDPEEVGTIINHCLKLLPKIQSELNDNQNAQKVLTSLSQELNDLNEWLPTIRVLCNPYLQLHHWLQIQNITKGNFNYKEISLNEVKYLNIKSHLQELALISQQATQEALNEDGNQSEVGREENQSQHQNNAQEQESVDDSLNQENQL